MCNCEIFQISGWDAIRACCKEMMGGAEAYDDSSSSIIPDPSCKNTVTVYASGTVIIRLSWNSSIRWIDHVHSKLTMSASASICTLLHGCC